MQAGGLEDISLSVVHVYVAHGLQYCKKFGDTWIHISQSLILFSLMMLYILQTAGGPDDGAQSVSDS